MPEPEPRSYGEPTGDPTLGPESTVDLNAISAHIERYWGKVDLVFHELISTHVHVDLHLIPATAERPYHLIITSGMSDRPMKPPAGAEDWGYAELLLALPPDWPLKQEDFGDERHYWPLRQLKTMARFPHLHETWLWRGHTLANGNPPGPYAPDVGFCAAVLAPPTLCDKAAHQLHIAPEKVVHFFSLLPLYEEELRFAWKHGSDALFERFKKSGINEVILKDRPNVCREN